MAARQSAIWLALAGRGAYGDYNGGLQPRPTDASNGGHRAQSRVGGGGLIAATDNGITIISSDGAARHYIADQTTDGRMRVALLAR